MDKFQTLWIAVRPLTWGCTVCRATSKPRVKKPEVRTLDTVDWEYFLILKLKKKKFLLAGLCFFWHTSWQEGDQPWLAIWIISSYYVIFSVPPIHTKSPTHNNKAAKPESFLPVCEDNLITEHNKSEHNTLSHFYYVFPSVSSK